MGTLNSIFETLVSISAWVYKKNKNKLGSFSFQAHVINPRCFCLMLGHEMCVAHQSGHTQREHDTGNRGMWNYILWMSCIIWMLRGEWDVPESAAMKNDLYLENDLILILSSCEKKKYSADKSVNWLSERHLFTWNWDLHCIYSQVKITSPSMYKLSQIYRLRKSTSETEHHAQSAGRNSTFFK